MAIRPDYQVGTLDLLADSADFTTTGSALDVAAVQAGDSIIAPSGHVLIIASITGQNSGTLFLPCPAAAAGTGLPLRIRFQPDGSRYQGAVRNLIDLLASGNLEALAALVGANGMVPIFTGPGTMDLADPATFGIQDPNGTLAKFAALTLAANRLIATNASGNASLLNAADLPVSTATQTALNAKANLSGANFTGPIQVDTNSVTIANSAPWSSDTDKWTHSFSLRRVANNGVPRVDMNLHEKVSAFVELSIQVTGYDGTTQYWGFRHDGATVMPGNVSIAGALSKASGTFLIDHPLDPRNRNLRHGFVEAPRYDLIYRGTVRLVDGQATVDIDAASNMTSGTFAALTTNAVVTSLQNQDGFSRLRPGPIDGGSFEIICEDEACTDLVSWVVIAERNDPFVKSDLDPNTDSDGRFIPEFEKEDA